MIFTRNQDTKDSYARILSIFVQRYDQISNLFWICPFSNMQILMDFILQNVDDGEDASVKSLAIGATARLSTGGGHGGASGPGSGGSGGCSRLSVRNGRSVVHKNLEDNYGAVISANHEALAQILEQVSVKLL